MKTRKEKKESLRKQNRRLQREVNEWRFKFYSMDSMANRMMDENERLFAENVRLREQLNGMDVAV